MAKRINNTQNYQRPSKTFQENLSNQEIKEKLKEYKKITDIRNTSIGTHIRYFSIDPNTKAKVFRLGGNLNKIDPEGRYVILSNGNINWSVQIPNTIFYQKMTETEIKEEMKKELKKEIMIEDQQQSDDDYEQLKKENKLLRAKIDDLKNIEKEYISLSKKFESQTKQLEKIAKEIKKEKTKK
jgi:hypothetical protein